MPPEFQRDRMAHLHGPGVLESQEGRLLEMTLGKKAEDLPCGTGRLDRRAWRPMHSFRMELGLRMWTLEGEE